MLPRRTPTPSAQAIPSTSADLPLLASRPLLPLSLCAHPLSPLCESPLRSPEPPCTYRFGGYNARPVDTYHLSLALFLLPPQATALFLCRPPISQGTYLRCAPHVPASTHRFSAPAVRLNRSREAASCVPHSRYPCPPSLRVFMIRAVCICVCRVRNELSGTFTASVLR
ncbi:hypothetical protein C8R47DRAFT_96687 [Mycena vitilis]|nr:hypothetical protein C8R47DRAFT_106515 [Mycena vitilis]KAJ6462646.1 hypothetical protein C8R47DRAFT_96687 [Mycena vitilis]